jgi:site-specific recombinase XerD
MSMTVKPAVDATVGSASLTAKIERFLEYQRSYRSHSPLTIATYRCDLGQFCDWLTSRLGHLPEPDAVTRELVMQWTVRLAGLASATVCRKISALSTFFGFLVDLGELDTNPARRIPLPKPASRIPNAISEEDAQRLIAAAASPFERAMLLLMLTAGLRRSEVGAIRLEDVKLDDGLLLVRGKGAKQRMVPLMPQTAQAIHDYLAVRPEVNQPYLFLSPQSRRLANDFLNRTLRRILARSGPGQAHHTAHAAPHLRYPPRPQRSGCTHGPGTPRPLRPRNHRQLPPLRHPRQGDRRRPHRQSDRLRRHLSRRDCAAPSGPALIVRMDNRSLGIRPSSPST